MNKKTKLRLLVLTPIIVGLLVSMTISDAYYSDMEVQYPILEKPSQVEGKVTGITVHHKYTFLELDAQTKVLVPPSFLKNEDPSYFHKTISIGDYFIHENGSEEVSLLKHQERLNFIVSKFFENDK